MPSSLFSKLQWKLTVLGRKLFRPATICMADGLKIHVDPSLPKGIRRALYKEVYEGDELKLVRSVLKKGDRVLDIGTGIGVIAAACARICGAENVTCYEANPKTVDLIQRNFRLNGMEVSLRRKAMATYSGSVHFYLSDNILSSSMIDRQLGEPTEIPCDDINDALAEVKPNIVVMDVEGAEIELLPYANLVNVSKLLVELHPHVVGGEKIDALCSNMADRGFTHQQMAGKNVVLFAREAVGDAGGSASQS